MSNFAVYMKDRIAARRAGQDPGKATNIFAALADKIHYKHYGQAGAATPATPAQPPGQAPAAPAQASVHQPPVGSSHPAYTQPMQSGQMDGSGSVVQPRGRMPYNPMAQMMGQVPSMFWQSMPSVFNNNPSFWQGRGMF